MFTSHTIIFTMNEFNYCRIGFVQGEDVNARLGQIPVENQDAEQNAYLMKG